MAKESTRKARTSRKIKTLSANPRRKVREPRKGTKLDTLVGVLSRKNGATVAQVAKALSKTGSPVKYADATSWIRYLAKQHGYGIKAVPEKNDYRCHLVQ